MQENNPTETRVTIWVAGDVQGVGFRWWTRSRALTLHLVGWARNLSDGRVEVVAQGVEGDCLRLLALLDPQSQEHNRPGRVDRCVSTWGTVKPELTGFRER
jgi:acylphosphatase